MHLQLVHIYLFITFPVLFRHGFTFHSYHAITLCPCTGMLTVFTVSSFLSVLFDSSVSVAS